MNDEADEIAAPDDGTSTDHAAADDDKELTSPEDLAGLFIELAPDKEGNWHWLLWAKNGRPIATNPVRFTRSNDALDTVKAVIEQMATKPRIVVAKAVKR